MGGNYIGSYADIETGKVTGEALIAEDVLDSELLSSGKITLKNCVSSKRTDTARSLSLTVRESVNLKPAEVVGKKGRTSCDFNRRLDQEMLASIPLQLHRTFWKNRAFRFLRF